MLFFYEDKNHMNSCAKSVCRNDLNLCKQIFQYVVAFIIISVIIVLSISSIYIKSSADTTDSMDPYLENTETVKVRLAAGFQHSAMIDYDGKLYVWGDNTYGQLGLPDEIYIDSPTELKLPEQVSEISLGAWHTLLLTESGKVYSMGRNTFGQLGDGTFENSNIPTLVEGLPAAVKISAGSYHSLILTKDGSVWGYGNNTNYQLAQAESDELQQDDGQTVARRTPKPEKIIDNNVVDIAAGGHFSLSLDDQGVVFAWGDNSKGQLGNGTNETQQFPLEINDINNITAVYAGYEYALAISKSEKKDVLFAWGDHSIGQLGASDLPGSGTSRLYPVRIDLTGDQIEENDALINISAGYAHVIATIPEQKIVKTEKSNETNLIKTGRQKLLVWGNNAYGQLGLGTNKSHYEPTVISGEFDGYEGDSFLPFDVVAAGGNHSLVMSSKGQLAACGQGSQGQLGMVSIIDRDTFTLVETKDFILPGWAENQMLFTEFVDTNDLIIKWPAAQDNLSVTGYKVVVEAETGQKQILEVGNKTERLVKNLNPDKAYAIAVYVYDEANAHLDINNLNVLRGAWLPENYSVNRWKTSFNQPINEVSSIKILPHNWTPANFDQNQSPEVPWSQTSVQEEKLVLSPEPFLLSKILKMVLLGGIIVSLAIWIGINFHKQRQIWYPIPKLPEGFGKKLLNKLLFLSFLKKIVVSFFTKSKQAITKKFNKNK